MASGSREEVQASLTATIEALDQALMHLRHLEKTAPVEIVVWARAHGGIVAQLARAASVKRGQVPL